MTLGPVPAPGPQAGNRPGRTPGATSETNPGPAGAAPRTGADEA